MKKILLYGMVLLSASCADFQKNMSDGMKAVNTALTPKSATPAQTGTPGKQVGTITNEQCKTSVGKTRGYFEQIVGFKLNETNSPGYTSFSEEYRFKISDRKDRFGGDLPVCMIFIDPKTDKVTTFSMPL